jgi:ABC-type Fe3+ transport system permease subunit
LRIAAVASLVFWLGQIVFVALELSFDQTDPAAQWWLGTFADRIIFTIWLGACVATLACLLALRAEWRRQRNHGTRQEDAASAATIASPGPGGQCSVS